MAKSKKPRCICHKSASGKKYCQRKLRGRKVFCKAPKRKSR